MVGLPDVKCVGHELCNHLVEDPPVRGQPLAREALDGVVEDEEGAVLDQVRRGLDGLQKSGDQLGPVPGNVVPGKKEQDVQIILGKLGRGELKQTKCGTVRIPLVSISKALESECVRHSKSERVGTGSS